MAHEKFPKKKLLFSEGCVEYSKFAAKDQLADARMYGHDITGDLNHGACAFIDWCILLSEKGGSNHVDNFVDVTAFLRPDGQVAVVLMNRTAERMPVYLRMRGEVLPVTVEQDAIMTVLINPGQ